MVDQKHENFRLGRILINGKVDLASRPFKRITLIAHSR